MNQEIIAKGAVSLEEFRIFSKFHTRKRETFAFFLSLILFFITFYLSLTGKFFLVISFSSLLSIIISVLATLFIKVINIQFAVKEYKSEPNIKGEMSYICNNEGIRLKSERSDAFFKWEDFRKAIEEKEIFILYVTTIKAIVVPKRFFDSQEDITLFKNIISENMDATKVIF